MTHKAKDPAGELSKRMLSGWTLLGDTCTRGCNVPLVENKRQKVIECVSCGTHFNRDAGNMVPITTPSSSENKEVTAQAPSKPTPTVQQEASTPIQDEDLMDDDEDFFPPPLSQEELAQMEERRKRNDRTSKIMGEKLLAGWTMLNDVCPKPDCYQPLMRDPQKQMWCLGCNTMVVRQEDFDPTKHKLVDPTNKTADTKMADNKSTNLTKTDSETKLADSNTTGNSGTLHALPTSPTPAKTPSDPLSPTPHPSHHVPHPTSHPSHPTSHPSHPTSHPSSHSSHPSSQPASANVNADARQRLYDRFSASVAPSLNFHAAHTHHINPHNSVPSSAAAPSSSHAQSSVTYAISVLQVKVHELGVLLSQSSHPDDIRVISSALKECGLAISALR